MTNSAREEKKKPICNNNNNKVRATRNSRGKKRREGRTGDVVDEEKGDRGRKKNYAQYKSINRPSFRGRREYDRFT